MRFLWKFKHNNVWSEKVSWWIWKLLCSLRDLCENYWCFWGLEFRIVISFSDDYGEFSGANQKIKFWYRLSLFICWLEYHTVSKSLLPYFAGCTDQLCQSSLIMALYLEHIQPLMISLIFLLLFQVCPNLTFLITSYLLYTSLLISHRPQTHNT